MLALPKYLRAPARAFHLRAPMGAPACRFEFRAHSDSSQSHSYYERNTRYSNLQHIDFRTTSTVRTLSMPHLMRIYPNPPSSSLSG